MKGAHILILILAAIIMLAASIYSANAEIGLNESPVPIDSSEDSPYNSYSMTFVEQYCNCDSECTAGRSCLTEGTDASIKRISRHSDDLIEEAENIGYRGICASVTVNNEYMLYDMTKECSAPEKPKSEGTAAEDSATEDHSDAVAYAGTVSMPVTKVIEISFDEPQTSPKASVSKSSSSSSTKKTGAAKEANSSKNSSEGFKMDVISASIIAGIFVMLGLFGLMAWVAYLLQLKTVKKSEQ